jgi:glucan phosphoethanolaminetransferase (alkaline phosphatase superfamily)
MREMDWGLSTGLETTTGLLCLLTSKEPKAVSHLNYTLPDFFSNEGFEVSFILAGDHHWQETHKAFGRKVDLFYDGSDHPGPTGICDDDLVLEKVAALKPDDGNYHFFYIHLISVHQAGTLEKRYLRYQPARAFFDPKFRIDYLKTENDLQEIRNMYDDRILQMDAKLKAILSLLRGKGYLKDYVALFTADHGQLLGEKNQVGHGYYASIGAIHVPMIFFSSKPLPSFSQSKFAVQIDMAPTLADLVFQDYPFSWQGQSLLRKRTNPWSYHLSPSARPGEEGAVVYYNSERILKFDRNLRESDDDRGRLYDLKKDPNEMVDLIDGFDPKFLAEIRAKAEKHFTTY